MYNYPLKPILIGVVVGFALFIVPFFLIKAVIFMLIIGGLLRLLMSRRFRRGHHRGLHPAFADTIRNMTEEEYMMFRQTLSGDYHYRKEVPITESK